MEKALNKIYVFDTQNMKTFFAEMSIINTRA